MFRTRLLFAAFLIAVVMASQGALCADEPVLGAAKQMDAKQLLANVRSYFKSVSSLRVAGTMDTVFKQDGKVIQKDNGVKFGVLFKRPNKFVLTSPGTKLYSDGKTFSSYVLAAKRYMKSPMNAAILKDLTSSKTGLGTIGMLLGVDYSSAVTSCKLLDDAKVGGKDVYVLSLNLKPGVAIRSDVEAVQTFWIGKDDLALYRNDIVVKMSPKAPKGYKGKVPKLVETIIMRKAAKFVANAQIPDSEFAFHPPAGTKPAEKPKPPASVVNKPAPNFSFKWTDGSTRKLSDFRGKKVILDFWAMPACEKHMPVLQALYAHQKGRVQLITINLNREVPKVKDYLKKKHLAFPVVWCDAQMVKTINSYGLTGLPTVFIVNEKGIVSQGFLGFPSEKVIASKLR